MKRLTKAVAAGIAALALAGSAQAYEAFKGPLGLLHLRGRLRPGRGLGSRLLGNRLGRLLPGLGRPLGRLPLGGGTPGGLGRCRTLPQVLLGGALGCLYLPLGPLFRQNIFQGKVLVIL